MKIELFHRFSNKTNNEKNQLFKMFQTPDNAWLKATKNSVIIDLETVARQTIWEVSQNSQYAAPMEYVLRLFAWSSHAALSMDRVDVELDQDDLDRLKKISVVTTDPDDWYGLGLRWWQRPSDGFAMMKNPHKAIAYLNNKEKSKISGKWPVPENHALSTFMNNIHKPDNWVSANYNAEERKIFMAVKAHARKANI